MKFELGKCYRHTTGTEIKILGEVETMMYGKCFAAECNNSTNLLPVGMDEYNAVNWIEINEEDWQKNFS